MSSESENQHEYWFDKDFSHVKTYDDYRVEFNRIKEKFGWDGEYMRFQFDLLHDYCSRNVKGMMPEPDV